MMVPTPKNPEICGDGQSPLRKTLCRLPWQEPRRADAKLAATLARWQFPAPPHDASGHTWHHPDAMLFKVTKYSRTQSWRQIV